MNCTVKDEIIPEGYALIDPARLARLEALRDEVRRVDESSLERGGIIFRSSEVSMLRATWERIVNLAESVDDHGESSVDGGEG